MKKCIQTAYYRKTEMFIGKVDGIRQLGMDDVFLVENGLVNVS